MPGPKLKSPAIEGLRKWIAEEPSVTDSWWEAPARTAAKVAGLDDPMGEITNLMSPTPAAPLISIFKNSAGIPSKLLREVYTKQFVEEAQQLGGPFAEAAERIAKTHPRVAAHATVNPRIREKAQHIADVATPSGQVRTRVPLSVTRFGLNKFIEESNLADNTIAHELTHIAQALGNKDYKKLYKSSDVVFGRSPKMDPSMELHKQSYVNNPFERVARARGERAMEDIEQEALGVSMGRSSRTRPMTQVVTPEMEALRKVIKHTEDPEIADQLNDEWVELSRAAGNVPFTAPRGFQNTVRWADRGDIPEFSYNNLDQLDALASLREIVNRRWGKK